ncbi:MAG: PD40 domain-containing protein [Planctomycetes bacterium]|nr:PD40 domain-containing protein [Planctomycetota bacterium]
MLTDDPAFDVSPVWSPDGRYVAFMSTRGFDFGSIGPFPGHLCVIDVAGSGLRRVTHEPLTSSLGPSDWSPDGRHLLLARVVGERPDLFELDVQTGVERRVTATPEGEYGAVYSSDGARIACHAETGSGSQIVVMDRDGEHRATVTTGPGYHYVPTWSPDDRWLVFTASDDGEQYDVRAVRLEDGYVIDVVATPEDEREAEFLPPR